MRQIWYDIAWEEGVTVPRWYSKLRLSEDGREGTLEGEWRAQKRSGYVVRVKIRRGALTFEAKRSFPVRSPRKAKALARRLVKETEQWLAGN